MNKNKLKIFATTSRTTLLSSIKERLEKLKVDEPKSLPQKFENGVLIDDVSFTQGSKYKQREELIKAVNQIGKDQIIEEISYTWFNRIVAIYFMQVNGYLKYGFNILPTSNSSRLEPEVVVNIHKANIPNLDKNKAIELSNAGKFNELYNYIILLVCNDLHTQLPFLFEKLDDYSELLVPSDLLIEGSLIQNIAKETEEEDWKEVEIIGWLYQFYITEKKDEIFASKQKIDKDSIGPATQLFTPKWIVKYMVENSVGKIWVQSNSKDIKLIENWKYFLKDDTKVELAPINKPEDITVIDPSMGSGHILVYAFDVLYQIYLSQGYQKKDIVRSILKNNLFGIDIDQRATQLASFALMMKACEYDSDVISEHIKLNLIAIQETNALSKPDPKDYPVLCKLYEMYIDALEYGSILAPSLSIDEINKANKELVKAEGKHDMFSQILMSQYRAIVEQTELLSKNYIIAITNPPYMGGGNMSPKLSKYVKDYYPDSKSDLFSVFIERCLEFAVSKGLISMITMQSWLFISSFESLRSKILDHSSILNLVHIGFNSFPILNSKFALATSFILVKELENQVGQFLNLNDVSKVADKELVYLDKLNKKSIFYCSADKFKTIVGNPIAYWISDKIATIFRTSIPLVKQIDIKQGLATGDNKKYLRLWFEVNNNKIGLKYNDVPSFHIEGKKWAPYNKGGGYRKWFGNGESIIAFDKVNYSSLLEVGNHLPSRDKYFKESITWSLIGLSFGSRYIEKGFAFDVGGSSAFPNKDFIPLYLAFLNSKLVNYFLSILNPTLNYQVGDVGRLPVKEINHFDIEILSKECIELSKLDWDSRETSWDFTQNELIKHKSADGSIKSTLEAFKNYWSTQFFQLHQNEEQLNKIFIEIYGLQDELTPDVPLSDITILKDEIAERDEENKAIEFDEMVLIKQFISYAVGCMVGRYSLDVEGLVYAGGEFDPSKYQTFKADKDGIIPILSDDRFDDDITSRFKEFVKVVFGEKNYSSNLEYIANVLGRKDDETAIECIRRYFLNDFYKDHVKMYKKRPIYWMYSSGKEKGFNAIVYMHRYKKESISILRMDYLHKLQRSYDTDFETAEKQEKSTSDSKLKIQLQKKMIYFKAILQELKKYDELLRHYADKQVEIDLDDGVVVNYDKFKDLLVKI